MPIARVKLPDGRVARFNVPDGTTPEQVVEFASGYDFGGTSQQEQPKKQIGVYGAQLNAESGGKDFDDKGELLRSKKGALGSRQVLLSTALDPGLPGVTPIDRNILKSGDKQAIAKELNRVGDEYMEALRKRYNGNEELALAAYNAGFGAVDKAGGRVPNIPETVAYVEKITGKKPTNISTQPYRPEPTGPTLDDYSYTPGIDASMVSNQPLIDFGAGAVRGAGSIGSTILSPYDAAKDYFSGSEIGTANKQRRAGIDTGLQALTGADPNSFAYGAGKLGAEVAGTWGMGGVLAKGASSIPGVAQKAPWLVESIRSGGMRTGGGLSWPREMLVRGVGGAATGAASAGAVDPEYTKMGAAFGGGLPIATRVAGKSAYGLGRALTGGPASQEVVDLAGKAGQLGIDVPADRLANSRPMNALASTLNYVPFSGRAATERTLKDQVKTAVARTFGQDTPNITQGLRRAQQQLGGEFERVLTSNRVLVDQAFLDDLANLEQMATRELEGPQAQIIKNQIDELVNKGVTGEIDGKAAYVIKRTLDKIGRRNSPEASYAIDLKKRLIEALNRSLGPDEAAQFANVRKMYGNMSEIEKIAQNGADGDISMARLANLRNINSQELQDIADIAATFVKDREGQHGAMQRFVLAALSANNPALLGSMMAAGRGANTVLNSQVAKRAALTGLNINPERLGQSIEGFLPPIYQLSGRATAQ